MLLLLLLEVVVTGQAPRRHRPGVGCQYISISICINNIVYWYINNDDNKNINGLHRPGVDSVSVFILVLVLEMALFRALKSKRETYNYIIYYHYYD